MPIQNPLPLGFRVHSEAEDLMRWECADSIRARDDKCLPQNPDTRKQYFFVTNELFPCIVGRTMYATRLESCILSCG